MTKEEEFLKRLLATFKIEAEEHVTGISLGLIELEKQPPPDRQKEIIEVIFREAHSLKGAARSVNLSNIELVCQAMESLFAALKRGEMALSTPLFDLLNDAIDIVNKLLSTPDTALTPEDRSGVQAMTQKLADAAKRQIPPSACKEQGTEPQPPIEYGAGSEPHPQPEPQHAPLAEKAYAGTETIRIPLAKLDSILLKSEELISAKLAARQHANLARELKAMLDSWKEQWSKFTSESHKSSQATAGKTTMTGSASTVKINEFFALNQNFSRNLESKLLGLRKTTDEDFRSISGMVDNLLDDMKNVMLFPFSSVLGTFPKLVRDIAREQGKEIDFNMQGGDIEIDKRILQEIKDPLIHLVRNSIDHGIETKEARKQKKKPEKGRLKIIVSQKDSGKVEIIIADDGAGINIDKVKGSAIKQGIITEDQATTLSNEDALNLIFESGITTSAILTTVSGRGLGMAIVREKIEKLGGTISIQTAPDEGVTFKLLLPLTLATFRGILIQSGGQVFSVPTMNIERIGRIPRKEVRTVENRETVPLHGKAVSLARLDEVLELPQKPSDEEEAFINVMIVSAGDKSIAFKIDEMLYEDEILLKNLGKQLTRVRNIAGATVLGSGRVIPILNVSDLIKSALKMSAGGGRIAVVEKGKKEAKKQSILVVEDSITARTLFVNILESVGYNITAAVDGVDAFTKLGEGEFALVVSDIQMPRMNGFELTEKIRADKKYENIPVVIVTGLESPEDKKRGIEVGANAYIVKSSFDQSNLLEVIKRLI
jgi:two-component system chemotaxis sensor kinase CheA